jgi:selenocysteine lyase/cysteine desulfurase
MERGEGGEAMAELRNFVGNVDAFPVLGKMEFFNHAGVTIIPRAASDALRKYAEEVETTTYVGAGWYADIERLRLTTASLMNATKEEVAFVKNTSEGISIVAKGIDWQWGDRIVTTNVEYPANIYPWMEVVRSHGCNLVMVAEETEAATGARHVPLEKILEAASHPKTRLVTISHVEYASGQRHDIAKIGAFCRERDILFCVDAIQSLGVLPVDVHAMNVDFLAADGHKWLLGPEGAGVFFCRKELIERMRPLMIGWMNVIDALNFGKYDYTLRPDAGRFECGSHNTPGLLALKASVEMLNALGIGMIAQRVRELTDRLIAGLTTKGYSIVSPRDKWQWSGSVSFKAKDPTDHEEIFQMLRRDHRTEIALREGRLRASPHFYNTEQQIDRLVEHLP